MTPTRTTFTATFFTATSFLANLSATKSVATNSRAAKFPAANSRAAKFLGARSFWPAFLSPAFLLPALLFALLLPVLAFAQSGGDANVETVPDPAEVTGPVTDDPWPAPIAFSWPIGTAEDCKVQFREFNWLCPVLETGADYETTYDKPFWDLAWVRVAHLDLDGDEVMDMIYEVQGGGNCGSRGCYFAFVFGGQPQFTFAFPFAVPSQLDPAMIAVEEGPALIFEPAGEPWLIELIKGEAQATIDVNQTPTATDQ